MNQRGSAAVRAVACRLQSTAPDMRDDEPTAYSLVEEAVSVGTLGGKVPTGPTEQYAYGFINRIVGGRRFVGHSGGASGMNGDLAFEPSGGYVVVVLSNFDPPVATQMSSFILTRLPATAK